MKTINHHLDKLLTNYRHSQVENNKKLLKLRTWLVKAKIKYGGNAKLDIKSPVINALIKKYLSDS